MSDLTFASSAPKARKAYAAGGRSSAQLLTGFELGYEPSGGRFCIARCARAIGLCVPAPMSAKWTRRGSASVKPRMVAYLDYCGAYLFAKRRQLSRIGARSRLSGSVGHAAPGSRDLRGLASG